MNSRITPSDPYLICDRGKHFRYYVWHNRITRLDGHGIEFVVLGYYRAFLIEM